MKLAVIGSRGITIKQLDAFLPSGITEIVSGGAKGVDCCAKAYAKEHHLTYTEFRPDYACYGRGAPILRNQKIVDYADEVIAFWDGTSRGTQSVIEYAKKQNKKITIYIQADIT